MQFNVAGSHSGSQTVLFRSLEQAKSGSLWANWKARSAKIAAIVALGLVTANCSTAPRSSSVDPKYGVAASPKKYGDGDEIPKGGGRYQTGRPYTVAGRTYYPKADPVGYQAEGIASWYGPGFHGRQTANGEYFDQHSLAAAHTTLPLPSYVRVTNLDNQHSIVVRVNDRGPFSQSRVIDLSKRTAEVLQFKHRGTARVRVEYIGKASVNGSDDRLLLASLTTDGTPAQLTRSSPVMVAEAPTSTPLLPHRTMAFADTSQTQDLPSRGSLPLDVNGNSQHEEAAVPSEPEMPISLAPLPPRRPVDLTELTQPQPLQVAHQF